MLKLYDYYRSSACYRVRIALNLKNLPFTIEPIHLIQNNGEQNSARYQAINPQSLVPTLEDGDQHITQSLAIIEYLEEKYPEPALLPKDNYKKALVRAFATAIAADLHPLNNLRVLKYLTQELNISEEQKTKWYHHWIHKGLHPLEKQLQQFALHGRYCFGDQPTLADVCLIPQLYNAHRFKCDMSLYPTLLKIEKNCLEDSAFIKSAPQCV